MALDDILLQTLIKNTEVSTRLVSKIEEQNDTLDKLVSILTNGMAAQLSTLSEFVETHGDAMKRRANQETTGRKPRSRWRDSVSMRVTLILLGTGFGLSLLTNVAITIWETVKQHAGIAGVLQ